MTENRPSVSAPLSHVSPPVHEAVTGDAGPARSALVGPLPRHNSPSLRKIRRRHTKYRLPLASSLRLFSAKRVPTKTS